MVVSFILRSPGGDRRAPRLGVRRGDGGRAAQNATLVPTSSRSRSLHLYTTLTYLIIYKPLGVLVVPRDMVADVANFSVLLGVTICTFMVAFTLITPTLPLPQPYPQSPNPNPNPTPTPN